MNGSNILKAPITTAQSIGAQVARGELGGMEPFSAFGKITTSGAVTKQIIWPNGAFTFPDQTTGETISFVSTSAEDGAGTQTGINSVEVRYLDVNLEPQTAIVELNGTTPVVAALTGVRFIQCLPVLDVGSTLAAVGEITAYREGSPATVFSIIKAGSERCESSLRMVPKGKQAVVTGLAASSVSGTAEATSDIELVATQLENRQYLDPFILIPQGSIGVQDNSQAFNLPVPAIYKEGTVIGFRTTTDKAATVAADWFGWLEDAGV